MLWEKGTRRPEPKLEELEGGFTVGLVCWGRE